VTNHFAPGTSPFDRTAPHTIVVLGPPRSGTSMVAGILRLLGIYMGECNVSNNEDPRFKKTQGVDKIRALIADNNAAHQVWGWKEPSTHMYYGDIADQLRAPFHIVVCRNVLGSVSSKLKHTGQGDVAGLMRSYAAHYVKIGTLVNQSNAPCLYVNYDTALADPIALAHDLSERFLGKPLDADLAQCITRYCVPGAYKSINDFL
jgi:hypothetical protein